MSYRIKGSTDTRHVSVLFRFRSKERKNKNTLPLSPQSAPYSVSPSSHSHTSGSCWLCPALHLQLAPNPLVSTRGSCLKYSEQGHGHTHTKKKNDSLYVPYILKFIRILAPTTPECQCFLETNTSLT